MALRRFNRYIVECKYNDLLSFDVNDSDLIDTQWNVNLYVLTQLSDASIDLIDTQWNVNSTNTVVIYEGDQI